MDNGEQNRPGIRLLKTVGAYVGAAAVAAASLGVDYLYVGRLVGYISPFPPGGAFMAGTYSTIALTYLAYKSFQAANNLRHDLYRPKDISEFYTP